MPNLASAESLADPLASRFAYRPDGVEGGRFMLRVPEIPQPSTVQRLPHFSDLGRLELLPVEILHLVLMQLDFRSISRFSRTSLRANAIVCFLPSYQDMMRYAPNTLACLNNIELIGVHTAATLHSALRRHACESCGLFGPFLFLPTCQRSCFTCLERNQSLWLFSRNSAQKYFGLSRHEIAQIPTMRSIPGFYWAGKSRRTKRRYRLVSVRSVKILAVQIHGIEGLKRLRQTAAIARTSQELHIWRWYQEAPLEVLSKNPSLTPKPPNTPSDEYPGMASIPFPYVTARAGVEQGIWCLGCDRLARDVDKGRLSRAVLDSLPIGVHPRSVLEGRRNRAWMRTTFPQHVNECPGVNSPDDRRYEH